MAATTYDDDLDGDGSGDGLDDEQRGDGDGQPKERLIGGKTREQIRVLEEQAKRTTEAESRAEKAEKTLAMRDAEVPNSPLGRFFADHYQGERTADAIKAAWAEIQDGDGSGGGGEVTDPPVPKDELDEHQQAAGASAGAGTASDSQRDADYKAELAKAQAQGPAAIQAVLDKYDVATIGD